MARINIFAERSEIGEALSEALSDAANHECRGATLGVPVGLSSMDENDVLLISRGLPRRNLLQLLGHLWHHSHAPRAIFYDTDEDTVAAERDVLELEPASLSELLCWIEQTVQGSAASVRIPLRIRHRTRARPIAAIEAIVEKEATAPPALAG